MPTTLDESQRKARKAHVCSYCGEIIEKGEIYDCAKCIYEECFYEWKTHRKCTFIANRLWSYIGPDECGMTTDDFQTGSQNFCREFICPSCKNFDHQEKECTIGKQFCTDKIADCLTNNNLEWKVNDRYGRWKLIYNNAE